MSNTIRIRRSELDRIVEEETEKFLREQSERFPVDQFGTEYEELPEDEELYEVELRDIYSDAALIQTNRAAIVDRLESIGLSHSMAQNLVNGGMEIMEMDDLNLIQRELDGLAGVVASVSDTSVGGVYEQAEKSSPEQRDFKRASKSSVEEHCSSCDHFLGQSNLDHKDSKGRPVYECPECGMHTVGKKTDVNEQADIESPRLSTMMYTVNLWGSDPALGNDDNWTSEEYASKEYAMHVYQYPDSDKYLGGDIKVAQNGGSELWLEIDGPGVYEKRQVAAPDAKRRAAADRAERSADRSEYAMQAGMGLGVDAYNDAMGYDTHEPGDGYRHRSAPAGSRYAESKNVNEQSSLYDDLTGPTDADYARNAPDEEIPEVQIPVEEIRAIRKFAQHWHDGQFSILYRIASSGTMYVMDIYEVESNLDFADNEATVDHSLDDDMGGITWGEVLMNAREEVNALNAKYALQEQLTFGTEEGMEEMETMWALVIGDGSLYGATYDPTGSVLRYWGYNGDDNWAIYELKNVPADIADHVVDHGSMNQVYSDGYQAWDAIKQYAEREPYAMGSDFNPTFAESTGRGLHEQMAPMGVLGGMKSAYDLEDGMGPGGIMCDNCGHVNGDGEEYCANCDTRIVEEPEEVGFAHNFREGTEVDVVLTHTHFGFQRTALIEGLKEIGVGRDKSYNMISELLAGAEVEIGRMDESKAYQVRQVLEEAGFVTEAVEAVSEDYNLNEGYVPSIYKGF